MVLIKKQNFPEFYVKNIASNQHTFEEGKEIAENEQKVQDILGNEEDRSISFSISDQKVHEVILSFYENGVAKGYQCTCKAFEINDGACRHVVAAMLHLNNFENEEVPTEARKKQIQKPKQGFIHTRNKQAIEDLLENYRKQRLIRRTNVSKEPVNIEYELHIRGPERVTGYLFSMKVGLDYLYVVHDVPNVVNDLLRGNEIEFGKRFVFTPENHRLRQEDREVLEYLDDIMNVTLGVQDDVSQAEKREVAIPAQYVKSVMDGLSKVNDSTIYFEKPNHPSLNREPSTALDIVQEFETLPLHLSINYHNDNEVSLLMPEDELSSLRFYPETDIILIDDSFYYLSTAQYQSLLFLRNALNEVGGDPLVMDGDQFGLFASEVLPQIRQFVHIDIADEINDVMLTPVLEPKLYIDYLNGTLFIRPVFKYMDQTVLPYGDEVDSELRENDRLIVRDIESENNVLEKLEDRTGNWAHQEEYLLTDDLDEMTKFLYEDLESLMENYEVYLTNAAQNIIYQPDKPPSMTVDVNENSNLLEISFQTEDISEDELRDILKELNNNKNYYRLSNGAILNLKDENFQNMNESLERLSIDEEDIQEKMTAPLWKGLTVFEDDFVDKGEQFRKLMRDLLEPSELEFDKPKLLEADLRSYQQTGFKWLKTLNYYGLGGILADDMGLGKTIQTIAYIVSEIEEGQEPFLVVCPSSVLFNWEREFEKFAPQVETKIIQGSKEERIAILEEVKEENTPVLITSYPLIQRDYDLYTEQQFASIILDEAQYVKNRFTKTSRAVKQLRSETIFALSGTPIENSLHELYSIFSIVQPGLFENETDFKESSTTRIAEKVRPFVLRRLKSEVLDDLPEKTETTEYIELSDDQKKLYQSQLAVLRNEVSGYLEDDTFQNNRLEILSGMTRLRQICNDPGLVLEDYDGASSKLARLLEYLEEARLNGKRVVLFSQFTKMLDIIREELDERGYDYHYLDGSTPKEKRFEDTSRFNRGEKDLFLISLKAGGTGLNLTGGDTVILYDSWWNPAVEDQAADRVHRFGQKKVVQVVRLITRGTIEERIHELQDQKRALLDTVIDSGTSEIASLTKDDVLKMLEM